MSGLRRVRPETSQRVLERLTVESRAVLRVRAFALRDEISSLLERNSVGRGQLYPRARNPSSAPGDPPARQSGRLINSVQARQRSPDVFEVGPARESFTRLPAYPVALEFGSRSIAPRPFMRPSVLAFREKVRSS